MDLVESNGVRLKLLLDLAEDGLKILLRKVWLSSESQDEYPTEKALELLDRTRGLNKDQLAVVRRGSIVTWDISLICRVLSTTFNRQLTPLQLDAIKTIQSVRNSVAHAPKGVINDAEFIEWFDRLRAALRESQLCDDMAMTRIRNPPIEHDVNAGLRNRKEANDCAKVLKEEGNLAFRSQNYERAHECYSKALLMAGLIDVELRSELYSNRSAVGFERKLFSQAMDDARTATTICFTQYKPHYRLAKALKAQGDFPLAIVSLEKAIAFASASEKVVLQEQLNDWKSEAGRRLRKEELNLNYSAQFRSPTIKAQLKAMNGHAADSSIDLEAQFLETQRLEAPLIDKYAPGYSFIVQARTSSAQGREDLAVQAYLRGAVECNNAEAMYNLSSHLSHGIGTERNLPRAFEWSKKASECPIPAGPEFRSLKQRAIGVSSGMFSVGLYYTDGIVVPKNEIVAMEYWKKAAALFHKGALNMIGLAYENGSHGVVRDTEKARDYFRMSAKELDTAAMLNLSFSYARFGHFAEALRWARTAREHGDHTMVELEAQLESKLEESVARDDVERFFEENPEVARSLKAMEQSMGTVTPLTSTNPFTLADLENCAREFPGRYIERLVSIHRRMLGLIAHTHDGDLTSLVVETANLMREAEFDRAVKAPMVIPWYAFLLAARPQQRLAHPPQQQLQRSLDTIEHALLCTRSPSDLPKLIASLEALCARHPDDDYFEDLLASCLAFPGPTKDMTRSLTIMTRLLGRQASTDDTDPFKMQLLYDIGVVSSLCVDETDDRNEQRLYRQRGFVFLQRFLNVAEPYNHRKVPQACYRLGGLIMFDTANPVEFDPDPILARGDASMARLPEFLRDTSAGRETLATISVMRAQARRPASAAAATMSRVFKRRTQTESLLLPPMRADEAKSKSFSSQFGSTTTNMKAPQESRAARSDVDDAKLKPISLEEMVGPRKDTVFNNRSLTVVVVSKAFRMSSVMCLVEDSHRFPCLLAVYNASPTVVGMLIPGRVLFIRNPYARCSSDGDMMVRIDYPKETLKIHVNDGSLNLCWGCLQEHERINTCTRCNEAQYCSKDCQVAGWSRFGHKFECKG